MRTTKADIAYQVTRINRILSDVLQTADPATVETDKNIAGYTLVLRDGHRALTARLPAKQFLSTCDAIENVLRHIARKKKRD